MRRLYITFTFLLAAAFTLQAQNQADALRYSWLSPVTTARAMAMGNSFGALGADFSTLSSNPAGIAFYRTSEFTVTPTFLHTNASSRYYSTLADISDTKMGIGNIGYVMAFQKNTNNTSALQNIRFGIGMNKVADFTNTFTYTGVNPGSSLLGYYIYNEDGRPLNQLDNYGSGLAWDVWLIDRYDTVNNYYEAYMPFGPMEQKRTITRSGGINEFVLSLGTNMQEKLYVGATVGIPMLRYEENISYSERDNGNLNQFYDGFDLEQGLRASGYGFNLKLGAIYRVNDMIRLGAAFHTPTYYKIEEDWDANIAAYYQQPTETITKKSDLGLTDYKLETPMRIMASAAVVLGKNGLISAEYERVDYGTAKFKPLDTYFSQVNGYIAEDYKAGNIFKVGTEWNLGNLGARVGYNLITNPHNFGTDSKITTLSGGLGYRVNNFFIDGAVAYSTMNDEDIPYPNAFTDVPVSPASLEMNKVRGLVTVGFKF